MTEPSTAASLDYVLSCASRVFGCEVRAEDDFFALGGDSLDAVEIATEVEQLTHRQVSPSWVVDAPSFGALAAVLDRGV